MSPTKSRNPLDGQASTLLLGAGIGAAIALSLVALRTKERAQPQLFGRNENTLASTLVRTAVYAIARASTRGSLTNLFARAVGNSLA